MDAEEFLNQWVDGSLNFIKAERAELAAWLEEKNIVTITSLFLSRGDQEMLDILGFRLRTWARASQVRAIKHGAKQLERLLLFAGRIAIAAINPGPT